MKTVEVRVIERLACVGYERMFEDSWYELHPYSIDRALWLEIATAMLTELRLVWNSTNLTQVKQKPDNKPTPY